MSEDDNEALRKWRIANPMRKWRKASGAVSIFVMAARIGCSPQSVTMWESGVTMPLDDSLGKIAAAMEMKIPALDKAWDAWLRDDPFKRGNRRQRSAPVKKGA